MVDFNHCFWQRLKQPIKIVYMNFNWFFLSVMLTFCSKPYFTFSHPPSTHDLFVLDTLIRINNRWKKILNFIFVKEIEASFFHFIFQYKVEDQLIVKEFISFDCLVLSLIIFFVFISALAGFEPAFLSTWWTDAFLLTDSGKIDPSNL